MPVISVDDHLIEPPDLFEDRLPAALAAGGPPGRRAGGRDPELGLRGEPLPQRRAQRGGGPATRGVEHGAGPLRRDAPGLLRHRRPHPRHGPRRHLGLAVLPVARLGVLRRRLLAGEGQGPRAGLPARLQRLAPGGVGGDPPGPHHPAAAALAGRRGGGRRPRCGPTRPAASRRSASPSSPPSCSCPPSSAATGTPSSPPARRRRRSSACTPARRPGPRCPRPTRRSSCCPPSSRSTRSWPPANGCGRACRCASRACRSPCPRAASAGCRC